MEGNFRNALIIVSAIVIGAIFIHGLWTIRKNKNPYKLKAKNQKVENIERGFDHSGFDQDGVSKPRVVNPASTLSDEEIPDIPAPAPEYSEDPIPKDLTKPIRSDIGLEPENENVSEDSHSVQEPVFSEEIAPKKAPEKSVYKEPVTQAKPHISAERTARKRASRTTGKEKLKRNQLGFDFDDGLDESLPTISAIDEPIKHEKPTVEPEVLVLSVVMSENQFISGAALLPSLLTLGMKYGDMNIFHRHEDNAGNGKVTFSLANMMNPGTFDLDSMESFATQGISLFMTLPNAGDAFEVFEQMLSAAKQLSQEFNGQLLDDKRSVMTKQTEQHYIGKIREFERKSRIAAL